MRMAKPCNQPQVSPIAFNHNTLTPLVMHATSHTSIHTHHGALTHGWMVVERLDDHTVMTNTPWFDGNHSLHQHHCGAQHPHPTHHSCRLLGGALAMPMPICTTQVAWKAWCCACHVLSFHSFHFCSPLCPSHSHSVCVNGSHSVSNTFTSEQVTVPTHLSQEGDSVDGTLQTRHTG